ncbi:hypothetical protein B0H13DRAFT_2300453 [Mycena leptocephala]|nr:hypothetical protein B0H13DRAFT_2300453 [Mycena leptocephala]
MYDVYIAAVAAALMDELCAIKLDVLAKAMRQKREQTKKLAAAAASANADAELADSTKTVGDKLSEQVKVELKKYHGMQLLSIPPSSAVALCHRRIPGGKAKKPHPARKNSMSTPQQNAVPSGSKPRGGGGNANGKRGTYQPKRGRGQ